MEEEHAETMDIQTHEHEFLVPDYYRDFVCKMGACRRACCVGWPISFSLEDYFRLSSAECNEEMRRKLDTGVKICLHPTPEHYAQISPRFDGECPMRLEDGRCAIHAELGEGALACVCRLYPRGVRLENGYECSCANSCEAVLELLFKRDEPIRFEKRRLSFQLPAPAPRAVYFETLGREQEIRMFLISIIQKRSHPLAQRLLLLGLALKEMEKTLKARDGEALDRLLSGCIPGEIPCFEAGEDHLEFGLATVENLIQRLDERSESIREYGQEALAFFGRGEGAFQRYLDAKTRFENIQPRWEICFEHMLVNHMFFSRFPFQDRPESLWDEFVAISGVYALLRFLSLGYMAQRERPEDFVDVSAAAFRLIDHTDFEPYAAWLLKSLGCTGVERVYDLIVL